MHTLKPFSLESIVSSSFEKTKQLLKSAKRKAWRYGALGLLSVLPTIGYSGTFSDDFEDGMLGSQWSIVADADPPSLVSSESNGKLNLKGDNPGTDELSLPTYSGEQILEASFDPVLPEVGKAYRIRFLDTNNEDIDLVVRDWFGEKQVRFTKNGSLVPGGSISYNSPINDITLRLIKSSSNIVTAEVIQDGVLYTFLNSTTIQPSNSAVLQGTGSSAYSFFVKEFSWSGPNIPDIISGDHAPPPTVAFDNLTSSGLESYLNPGIPVSLNKTTTDTVTLQYAIHLSSTATNGVDYNLPTTGTLTIDPLTTTTMINPSIINDNLFEGNETITLSLSNPTNATLGTSTQHTYTIQDDESTPTLQFETTASSGDESTSPSIKVVMLPASDSATTFTLSVGGSASSPADYTLATGVRTIDAGTTSTTIIPSIVDDNLYEGIETIILGLSNPNGAGLGTNTQHTLSINDNQTTPTLYFSPTNPPSGNEHGIPPVIQATLSGDSASTITAQYRIIGGNATPNVDFTTGSSTLIFPPLSPPVTIPLTINPDSTYENDENIVLELYKIIGANSAEPSTQSYQITNDNPKPTVGFNASMLTKDESTTLTNILVTLTPVSGVEARVDYQITPGTATPNDDFTTATGTLIFPPGSPPQSIPLNTVDDNLFEGNIPETVLVQLITPLESNLGQSLFTYHIQDNETTPTLRFETSSSNGFENTNPTIRVVMNPASSTNVTFSLNDLGGSASNPSDYTLTTGTRTIDAGTTSTTVTPSIVDDNIYENNENFTLGISNPSPNATLQSGQTTHDYTINNNEAQPNVSFIYNPGISNSETVTNPLVIVALSGKSQLPVTVNYDALSTGTATRNVDYSITPGMLTFDNMETTRSLPLSITNDRIDEQNEYFVLGLQNPVNSTLGINPQVTYNILNDDHTPTIDTHVITPNPSPAVEGSTIDSTVFFSDQDTGDVLTVERGWEKKVGGTGLWQDIPTTATFLTGTYFNKGDEIRSKARVSDGVNTSNWPDGYSNLLTIFNTPPNVLNPNITTTRQGDDFLLQANYQFQDVDPADTQQLPGSPQPPLLKWYRDGTYQPTLDNLLNITVPNDTITGGSDNFYFTVKASDGLAYSSLQQSNTETVSQRSAAQHWQMYE